jgi:hypothetical protein
MRNKSIILVLLCTLLLVTGCIEKTEAEQPVTSKEFLPGKTLVMDTQAWDEPFAMETWVFKKEDKAELVKNFGPNGEEALKISSIGKDGTVVSVRYNPNLESFGRYKMTVEYKANYKAEEGAEFGAVIKLYTHPFTVVSQNNYVPLYNVNRWSKAELTFDYSQYDYSSPEIIFSLGVEYPKLIFSSGNLYFINLKIEKLED